MGKHLPGDACCTPVLLQRELEQDGFDQRPIVTLKDSPAIGMSDGEAEDRPPAQGQGIGVEGQGWWSKGLRPSTGGEETLAVWMGWSQGRHYAILNGGLVKVDRGSKL